MIITVSALSLCSYTGHTERAGLVHPAAISRDLLLESIALVNNGTNVHSACDSDRIASQPLSINLGALQSCRMCRDSLNLRHNRTTLWFIEIKLHSTCNYSILNISWVHQSKNLTLVSVKDFSVGFVTFYWYRCYLISGINRTNPY